MPEKNKEKNQRMNRFSAFDMDPEDHIESDNCDDEEENEDEAFEEMIDSALDGCVSTTTLPSPIPSPIPSTFIKEMVCQVPSQTSYQCGRLMCSICSTLLGLCVSSGVMPNPGEISPSLCAQLLGSIMERSSAMQSKHMKDMNEMKQISEVLSIIDEEGMMMMYSKDQKSKKMVECFGPLSHDHVSEDVSAEGCMIKGLDMVMMEDLNGGDGIIITTRGHTVYMLKSDENDTFFVFDPLYGTMDKVSDGWKGAYDSMGYGRKKHHKNVTGLEDDKMYTAMIMRPFEKLITEIPKKRKEVDTEITTTTNQTRATKMKVQIMEEATRVLESMRQEGGPVVQALRLSKSSTSTSNSTFVV